MEVNSYPQGSGKTAGPGCLFRGHSRRPGQGAGEQLSPEARVGCRGSSRGGSGLGEPPSWVPEAGPRLKFCSQTTNHRARAPDLFFHGPGPTAPQPPAPVESCADMKAPTQPLSCRVVLSLSPEMPQSSRPQIHLILVFPAVEGALAGGLSISKDDFYSSCIF